MAKMYQRTVRETVERTEWVYSNSSSTAYIDRDDPTPIAAVEVSRKVEVLEAWDQVTDPLRVAMVKELGKTQEL